MRDRESTGWIVVAIVACGLLALGGFVGAAFLDGAGQSIVSGVSSALVSIALALLITEVFLRPLYTSDVLKAAGLSRRVSDIGFRDVKSESQIDFGSFYRQGGDVWVTVVKPNEWIRHIDLLVDAAASKRARFSVAFPQPGGSAHVVAAALGKTPESLDAEIEDAVWSLQDEWRGREILHSSLVIHWMESVPRGFVASNGVTALVGLEPSVHRASQPTFVLELDMTKNSDVEAWVSKSLRASRDSIANPEAWQSSGGPG